MFQLNNQCHANLTVYNTRKLIDDIP
jgi:hypothetical protein